MGLRLYSQPFHRRSGVPDLHGLTSGSPFAIVSMNGVPGNAHLRFLGVVERLHPIIGVEDVAIRFLADGTPTAFYSRSASHGSIPRACARRSRAHSPIMELHAVEGRLGTRQAKQLHTEVDGNEHRRGRHPP